MAYQVRDIFTLRQGEVFRYKRKWWVMDNVDMHGAVEVGRHFSVLENGAKFSIKYDEIVGVVLNDQGKSVMTTSREYR